MDLFRQVFRAAIMATLTLPATVQAKEPDPGVLVQLRQCRLIADGVDRLACYDRQIATLQSRFGDKELAIVDRAKADRNGSVLADADGNQVASLDTTVTSAGRSSDNRLAFAVANGTGWVQTDDFPLFGIKPGRTVTLKQGALGSFFAVFPKTIPIRVKRVR